MFSSLQLGVLRAVSRAVRSLTQSLSPEFLLIIAIRFILGDISQIKKEALHVTGN